MAFQGLKMKPTITEPTYLVEGDLQSTFDTRDLRVYRLYIMHDKGLATREDPRPLQSGNCLVFDIYFSTHVLNVH